MTAVHPQPASIVEVRSRIAGCLQAQGIGRKRAPVIVFAVDGVTCDVGRRAWQQARVDSLASIFPTTSSSAWLSSLTGMRVADHGIPGVVFKWPDRDGALINVFSHSRYEGTRCGSNLFSDAADAGYLPIACGDFDEHSAFWRDITLAHASILSGQQYFGHGPGHYEPQSARAVIRRIEVSVGRALAMAADVGRPCLLWCFIEVDRHVHELGYDAHVDETLVLIDALAARLAGAGMTVVAYSDHGLTRTSLDEDLTNLIRRLEHRFGLEVGGAGRTRWLHLKSSQDRAPLWEQLSRHVSSDVTLGWSRDYFPEDSLAERRVGDIVLVARGERFLCTDHAPFDHGSLLSCEVDVPFAVWQDGSVRCRSQ
jgi:hypothetical protein